jgi:molybdopterin synthase catalytic subunit
VSAKIYVQISKAPLKLDACMQQVADPGSGGNAVFIGTVRNETNGRPVLRLEFETYTAMALSELQKIAETARERWPINGLLIHHREGTVPVGETAVIIVATAARRDAAFEACRYAIDTLKQTVPIWKKEIFEDGEEWVHPHP